MNTPINNPGNRAPNQLPGSGTGGPIPSIARPGAIYQRGIQTVTIQNAGNTAQFSLANPIFIPSDANAFYIVDSPFPLVLSNNINPLAEYASQTGESFNQKITRLGIQAIGAQVGAQAGAGTSSTLTFTFKIWVGYDSHVGFIDHRTCWDTSDVQVVQPLASGVTIILANALLQPVTTYGLATPGGTTYQASNNFLENNWFLQSLSITNISTTNAVYLMDPYNSQPLQACPAGSTVICPFPWSSGYSISASATTPDINGNAINTQAGGLPRVFFTNYTANATTISVNGIYRTKSYFIQATA